MGKTGKNAKAVGIIGGSDGPTSIFVAGRGKKRLKQRIYKYKFETRRKYYASRIKPHSHEMKEVIAYIKEKYGFDELAKDTREYKGEYDNLRASFIMHYQPELLGEYSKLPELLNHDEEGVRVFQEQLRIREQKAKEISEDIFSIDYHILKRTEKDCNMHINIETRFGYIGGGYSGLGRSTKRIFDKIYKDVYLYYGVTEEDIANKTSRYKSLLTTLAMRN